MADHSEGWFVVLVLLTAHVTYAPSNTIPSNTTTTTTTDDNTTTSSPLLLNTTPDNANNSTVSPTQTTSNTSSWLWTWTTGSVTSDASADDVTSAPPNQRPLCWIDLEVRKAVCDASWLAGLPQVALPRNITRLVVTREGVAVGGGLLGGALNGNNLTRLHNLEQLTINHFGLRQLQNSTFANLPHLQLLDLSWNQISHLQDVTFVGLSRLTALNLSHNTISVLQHEYFNLPSLRHLALSHNAFTTIPTGTFKLLPLLQTLMLDGNDLGSLTSGGAFLGLDHLRELSLSGCNLHVTHALFAHTQSVDTLSLADNGIHNIPTEAIKQLYFLQTIVLSHNQISAIPGSAFQGLAMRVLDLSHNIISKIDKSAFRNFRTEELYLGANRIHSVPRTALENLARNLFVLNLSANPLDEEQLWLPDDLGYLHTLNLSSCGLHRLPDSLRHLYQLHTLDVSSNRISTVNASGVRLLRHLEADGVRLQGNPWSCDCGIVHLLGWLQRRHLEARRDTSSRRREHRTVPPPGVNASSLLCAWPADLAGMAVLALPASTLEGCARHWQHTAPTAVYAVCGLAAVGVLAALVVAWRRRAAGGYGRFCGGGKSHEDTYRSEPLSPIKVISNAGAGAMELPNHQGQGPVKNRAWESALVISNPCLNTDGRAPEEAGRGPGSAGGEETLV